MARIFTIEEAEALLPRLRELLGEMQAKKGTLDSLREELQELEARASGNGHLLRADMAGKRRQATELAERLNELLAELNTLGCELKGIEQGLIDFPWERAGQTVYLCWRLGEEHIGYWHEIEAGFAGRQPL